MSAGYGYGGGFALIVVLFGCEKMGLALENEEGIELTSGQIIKRMAYRDTVSTFDYLKIQNSSSPPKVS